MNESILVGQGSEINNMPYKTWRTHLKHVPLNENPRFAFMSTDHHKVRYFVVRELPKRGSPIPPEIISMELGISIDRTIMILDELEENLFFLVRNELGDVLWAFPMTAEKTPHRLLFKSGERLYAAGAEDAVAAPFVQGNLVNKNISLEIHTSCIHCSKPIQLEIDREMNYRIQTGSDPLVFSPSIDWDTFNEPNIIHAYGKNSLFFWSEEHARDYRPQLSHVDGEYLTMQQMAKMTPFSQGNLFGF